MNFDNATFGVWPAKCPSFASFTGDKAQPLTITPTDLEQKIFDRVLATIEHFKLKVEVRVAGGWVRDKLLGRESDDIDFAVDTMMGEEFAERVNAYLALQGEDCNRVAVIQKNPGQSKHLETATFRLCGVSVDCNNLRSEIYTDDSRIPTMEVATAEEDALRRDFTINSMFYNVRTKQVEDLVGQGLSDLSANIIRTPLPPRKTFLDDPLRILRAARFAGKLGSKISADIAAAASDTMIQTALMQKVSRERYGIEVNKTISLEHPRACLYGLQLLCEWRLRAVIFQLPSGAVPDPEATREVDPTLRARADEVRRMALGECKDMQSGNVMDLPTECELLTKRCLECVTSAVTHAYTRNLDVGNLRMYILAAFLTPLHGLRYQLKKAKHASVISYIVRESLRLPIKDGTLCTNVTDGVVRFHNLTAEWRARDTSEGAMERIQLGSGLLLRSLGEEWVPTFVLAEALESSTVPADGGSESEEKEALAGAGADVVAKDYADFRTWLMHSSGLFGGGSNGTSASLGPVWRWKPAVNGKQISVEFNVRGKEVGALMIRQMELCIARPALTADPAAFLEAFKKVVASES